MTALLLAALLAAPAADAPLQATLVEGLVTVNGGPLAEGDPLHSGDTVQTNPGARLEITLASGSRLRLGENTRLTLGALEQGKRFSARLFLGNLWAKVHKLAAAETWQLETENAVAGVRGTELRVEVEAGKEDLVRVYEGAVEVRSHEGKWSHRLEPGNELRFARERATPRAFDPASERDHPLMRWVRARPAKEGGERRRRPARRERRKGP